LNSCQANPAATDYRYPGAWPDIGSIEDSSGSGHDRAPKKCQFIQRHILFNHDGSLSVNRNQSGEQANPYRRVDRLAVTHPLYGRCTRRRRLTAPSLAPATLSTIATGNPAPDCDVIADLDVLDALTHSLDDARPFVAEQHGEVKAPSIVTVVQAHVRVANARGTHLHQHLTCVGTFECDFLD
jgi:hypothetical protein